jgi:MFS transporter, AAHS family, cis,cis-muconate transporter
MSLTGIRTEPAPVVQGERVTGYVILVITLTFLCNVFLGEETRAFSFSVPFMIKEFHVTPAEIGFIQTVAAWIGLFGWFGVLLMADGMGRKPAFLAVLLGYTITAPLIGLSQSFLQLAALIGLAAIPRNTGTINYMLLAETVPPRIRALVLSFLNSSVVLAYMATALLAGVMVPLWGWRSLFFIDAACIFVLLVAWWKLRETTPFLNARAHRQAQGRRQRPDLLLPWRRYPGRAFLGFSIQVVYLAAYPSFSPWQTAWLVNEVKLDYVQSTNWVAIWLGASAVAYWLCGWMSNQFGKRVAVPLFATIGGCFFLAIIFGHWDRDTIFWLGLGLNFFVTGHYGSGSYAYVNELFPAQIRGSVQASFALVVGFVVSWGPTIPPLIAGNSLEHISRGFLFPMAMTFAAAVIFLFFAPETARKPLDDIVAEAD